MITDLIVGFSMAFVAAFSLVWWLSPRLRAFIEQPKHAFQEQLRRHEAGRSAGPSDPAG